jgi:nitroreductase
VLVVVGLRDQAWKRSYDGYNSVETDAAIAMTHIVLAAENEGVGACWIAAYDPVILKEALKEILGTADDKVIFGITPLGYPRPDFRKSGIKKRKTLEEIFTII